MTISVTIQAETASELHAKVLGLIGQTGFAANVEKMQKTATECGSGSTSATGVADTQPVAEIVELPKKTRAAKAKVEEPKASEPVVEEPAAEKTEIAIEDIKAALGKVRDTKGMEDARKLLGDFNAKKVSDVAPDDYAAFLVKAAQYAAE